MGSLFNTMGTPINARLFLVRLRDWVRFKKSGSLPMSGTANGWTVSKIEPVTPSPG
jgi:hypothetical protein